MKVNEVLIAPVLTEKATGLAARQIYEFQVNKNARKSQIKEAVEKLYSVKVKKIAVMNRKGKAKRVGKRMKVKKMPTVKIAIITTIEGKINLYPQT